MISELKINSRLRRIGPVNFPLHCSSGYGGHRFSLCELPPHKRNIVFRRLIHTYNRYESQWEIASEETFCLQMPYVFLLFESMSEFAAMTTFMAFGKEPFGKNTDLWFPSLPNVFDHPMCQVCTPHYSTIEEQLAKFWNSAFYDFANREDRFAGTTLATNWLGGFSEWAKLDLNGLYDAMKWRKVTTGAFNDFQMIME